MAQTNKGLDITTLSLEQLNMLKGQLEEELQVFSTSWQQLKLAGSRYNDSKEALAEINPGNEGKSIMVPLTSSLFVPGNLTNTNRVLLDVGTGYYVSKTVGGAQEFFDRKVKMINDNTEQVSQALAVKRKNLESVLMVMQNKIEQLQGQGQGEAQ
eukprot:TRINITY_DN4415_c0_g1_i1.p1 TRINITY_DN4415_c0_g1~~TRINITY_DN4415_c0_g1_i1.p1  ORF type:complete len:155 (-),score=42.05 TRINITY_DN4415_c0_g1_i1:75-539(-)